MMKDRNFNLHDGKTGAAITVRVTPRAARTEISEILPDGTIHVHVTAANMDERSNQALLSFLADVLGVRDSQLEIVAGMSGNDKLITITDLDKAAVQERILKRIG
jgi:uncharacterized protein